MTIGDRFSMYAYNIRLRLADYGVTCPLKRFRYFGADTNDTSNPVGLQDWYFSYDNIGNRLQVLLSKL